MTYSLGVEPSDLGSGPVGGGLRCRLVSSFVTLLDAAEYSAYCLSFVGRAQLKPEGTR